MSVHQSITFLVNISCALVKVKGQIMYLPVNASPPKRQMYVATSNFTAAYMPHDVESAGQHFMRL